MNPSYFDVNYRGTIGFGTLPYLEISCNSFQKPWALAEWRSMTASRTAWFRFTWSDFGRPTVNDAIQRQGWLGTQKYLFFLLATNSGDRSKQPSIIALALILGCKIPCQERVFMWPPSCTVFLSRRVDNILRQTDVVFLDAKDERVEIEWNLIACILAKNVKCIRFSWIIYCFLARKAEKYVPSPKGPAARGTAILWKQHVKIRSTYIISSFGNLQKRSENRKGDVQAAYNAGGRLRDLWIWQKWLQNPDFAALSWQLWIWVWINTIPYFGGQTSIFQLFSCCRWRHSLLLLLGILQAALLGCSAPSLFSFAPHE